MVRSYKKEAIEHSVSKEGNIVIIVAELRTDRKEYCERFGHSDRRKA